MTQPPEPGSGYSPPPGFPPPGPAGPAGSAPAGAVTIPGRGPVQLATVGQRFLARLVDAVIFGVLYAVLAAVGVGGMNATVDPQTGEPSTVGVSAFITVVALFGVIGLAYEVVLIALKGQTLGKMALGVQVVRAGDGQVPGWGPSIVRWLIPFAGSFVCGVGQLVVYLSVLFDSSGRRQGWHDKAANTLVISTR